MYSNDLDCMMVETSMYSKFRDDAYGTETSKANKFSEVNINWVFQYDKCVIPKCKTFNNRNRYLGFLTTL